MLIKDKNIAIIGAGLVGSLLSIYFAKMGAKVSVFERRNDMRKETDSAGRSINLALSNRGIKALREVGIEKDVMSTTMPMYKRIMHSLEGELTEQYYGKKDQAIYSVGRRDLKCTLMDLAERKGVKIYFSQQCSDLDFNNNILKFKELGSLNFDFIFGADGAGSIVRKKMKQEFSINTEERFIDCGYKELTIPANINGQHIISNKALHIWPRGSFMIIALPNLDGTFTCTLFFPMKGDNSFESLKNEIDLIDFFKTNFADLVPLIPDLSEQYFRNPLASLGLIRCDSWTVNNIALIGDSCHATVPFYGQGMNAGFEDCFLLYKAMQDFNTFEDFKLKLPSFLKKRKIDTDAMQELSLYNFIVMRDKTADDKFLLQKKIEALFSKKHPDKWLPLYSMVTFSDVPYSHALKIGQKQNLIMEKVMNTPNINKIWDGKEVEDLILSYLL